MKVNGYEIGPGADLLYAGLRGNLSGADLRGADLRYAYLDNTKF